MTPLEMGVIEFCTIRPFVLWHVLQEETQRLSMNMHPPPSGRHAMRSLYVIGRDGWVWDMSNTQWLEMDSSHRVGECSVSVVCPLAGVYSRRRLCEIIVEQTIYSIYIYIYIYNFM